MMGLEELKGEVQNWLGEKIAIVFKLLYSPEAPKAAQA